MIKAKTIIERHGFLDPDRCKSIHDEIQVWVFKNFKSILESVYPNCQVPDSFSLELEHAIMNGKYVVGFIDVYCSTFSVGVEIKTSIPLLGELIRQIHFYSKYSNISKWIVVSPDDHFATLLGDQKIHFLKYQKSISDLPLFG